MLICFERSVLELVLRASHIVRLPGMIGIALEVPVLRKYPEGQASSEGDSAGEASLIPRCSHTIPGLDRSGRHLLFGRSLTLA